MPHRFYNNAPLSGLSEVMTKYDAVILDLWGVVHDGVKPFPDTIETLQALRKLGKKIWFLSNAPRRAWVIAERLTAMGIEDTMYDGLVTSGEATFMAMRDKHLAEWGNKCYHIGGARDKSLYAGLDIEIMENPLDANFVLCSGVVDFSDTVDKYAPLLKACAGAHLPMICANPDRLVHVEEQVVICAGMMADLYQKFGQRVEWYGKPYRDVYSMCREGLGDARILAVGDGMETDIAGATGAGIDSVLITSGIHRDIFEQKAEEGFFSSFPYHPAYHMVSLRW